MNCSIRLTANSVYSCETNVIPGVYYTIPMYMITIQVIITVIFKPSFKRSMRSLQHINLYIICRYYVYYRMHPPYKTIFHILTFEKSSLYHAYINGYSFVSIQQSIFNTGGWIMAKAPTGIKWIGISRLSRKLKIFWPIMF